MAAWTSSAGMFSARLSTIRMATAQVTKVTRKRERCTGRDGLLKRSSRANHVGRDRREHEDAFESFAKDEDGDVENAGAEIAVTGWVGQAAGSEDLEKENRGDCGRASGHGERRKWYPFQHVGDMRPFESDSQVYIRPSWSSIVGGE